jgi:hypothetical protein
MIGSGMGGGAESSMELFGVGNAALSLSSIFEEGFSEVPLVAIVCVTVEARDVRS